MQSLLEISEAIFIGMNDRYPPGTLDPGMFALLQNVLLDQQSLQKRNGTTPVATAITTQNILGLCEFDPISGTKYLIACVNGSSNAQIYYWTGSGNWTALGSANLTINAPMNFVQAGNYLYGFNGTDVVQISSGPIAITHNPASVPAGLTACWFHEYLFVANITGYPNRVFFSNQGDPTTFTWNSMTQAGNWVPVNEDDGDQIYALTAFNDELYIFKENSIWSISGFTGSTFSETTDLSQNTNNIIYGYGTTSQQSVVSTGKDLYYLSFEGTIPMFRSFTITAYASTLENGIVSMDIEGTMKTLSAGSLNLVSGCTDGKYIYWSVPLNGSSYNNATLVLEPSIVVKSKTMTHYSWVKWVGFNAAQFAVSDLGGENKIYFGDATLTGNISLLNASGYTDNGTAVVMDVYTREYYYKPSNRNKYKYIYTTFDTGSAGTLKVNARIDEAINFTNQDSISLYGQSPPFGQFIFGQSVFGGQAQSRWRTTFAQMTGNRLQVEFYENSANAAAIRHWEIYGTPKGLRNG